MTITTYNVKSTGGVVYSAVTGRPKAIRTYSVITDRKGGLSEKRAVQIVAYAESQRAMRKQAGLFGIMASRAQRGQAIRAVGGNFMVKAHTQKISMSGQVGKARTSTVYRSSRRRTFRNNPPNLSRSQRSAIARRTASKRRRVKGRFA